MDATLKSPRQIAEEVYGGGLKARRRPELFRVCRYHDIEVNGFETKDRLLHLIEGSGIDIKEIPTPDMIREKTGEIPKDLEGLSVPELRGECKRRGITWELTDKKVTLLEKLNGPHAS